jgi:serine/threonine protein kinase
MTSIKDFTILKTLYENPYQKSKILLATHINTDEPKYIIRVIENQRIKDLELKIHTTLKHRKLIKYHTHFKDDRFTYIILEHAPTDLLDYTHNNTLTQHQISYIIRQILEITQYLHFNNIAHMDIKLENIVVFPNFKIKLIDFGLAHEFKTTIYTSIGTPECHSPEMYQLHNKLIDSLTIDEKTDIWCIGCITYELTFNKEVPKHKIHKDIEKLYDTNKKLASFLKHTLLKRSPIKQLLNHPFIQQ